MNKQLPLISKKFFLWYCIPRLQETIMGDLEEQFEEDLQKKGPAMAKARFTWNVIRFFRPGIIKPLGGITKLNYYGMIKNDFKAAFRVIKRERLYSGINILGLTSGFVIALLILFYVRFEQSYEDYNPNSDKIVRITMDYLDGETLIDQDCETYHNLGPMIKDEFPEVEDYTRAFGFDVLMEIDERFFRESKVYAVDASFLSIFGYPLLYGEPKTALKEPNQVVLTESTALKYFGTTNAIGKTITMDENTLTKVVGVIADNPTNTHLKFNLVFSYSTMKKMLSEREDIWNSNDTFTYLKLSNSDNYPRFKENLATLSDQLRAEDHIPDERIISQKIEDIHLYSHKSYEAEQNGSSTLVIFLFGVALLVILIAIVNYINLSTVKSMDRAKEVGIRKVVGSSVAQLRMRFFLESIIINLIAGLASIMLILVVFDSFKTLANLPESTQIINDWSTWKLLGLLFILSTVLSGIFPSLILSSLSPTSVLKGKFSHSSSGIILRKGLVIVQFSIATFLLIQTFTASKQLSFMMNKDLGFDANQVVVMNGPSMEENRQDYISFKNSLLERSAFQKIGLSSTVPGMATGNMGSTTNLNLDEDERDLKNNFYIYHVDSSFFETMGMEIIEGENFSNSVNFQYPILINEEALREWGISDPKDVIHKKMTYWGRENTIIGVVRDFHQIDAKSGHLAMAFNYSLSSADYISVKLGPGNVFEQIEDLEEIYKSHFGHDPFDPFFLDQNFDAQYRADQQFQQVFGILSVFAILITCLGLFGLASFTVAKRAKEIGIRKVLGANVSQLITLLSKDFVALVLTSSIIALPITYFLVKNWLEQYTFRIDLSFWLFAGPTLFILVIAFFTVFSKTFHVSNANPVNSLKDE